MASLVGRFSSSLYRAGSRRVPVVYSSAAAAAQKSKTKPADVRRSALAQLNQTAKEQLKFEKADFEKLPKVEGFECSVSGAVATFQKHIDNGEIKVVVDVNCKTDMDLMNKDENEDDDLGGPAVPAFTVTVKNASGDSMQLECSYDTVYDDVNDSEEMKLQVDSVTMIPKNSEDLDFLYSLPATELPEEMSNSLEKYMNAHGIDHRFGADLLSFFQVFDHQVYIREFLEKLEEFSASFN